MKLEGKKITLRAMTENDKNLFYQWSCKSDTTPFLYGEMYGDSIPTYEALFEDYKIHYFKDESPELGRCFAIELNNQGIGQISYNEINPEEKSVDLDIWIAESRYFGKGHAREALQILSSFLFENFDLNFIWIDAVQKNPRAVRAYQKAGFEIEKTYAEEGIDWIRLVLPKP